jgi:hypothetical protein
VIELYHKRWQIELTFRDVKTTMGMELIAAKCPELALKQIWMFVIAHNLIRYLINRANENSNKTLSFKGTLDTLITFSRAVSDRGADACKRHLNPLLHLLISWTNSA